MWDDTVYQLIFDTSTGSAHIRNAKHGGTWTELPLRYGGEDVEMKREGVTRHQLRGKGGGQTYEGAERSNPPISAPITPVPQIFSQMGEGSW